MTTVRRGSSTTMFESGGLFVMSNADGTLQLVNEQGDVDREWMVCDNPINLREWR